MAIDGPAVVDGAAVWRRLGRRLLPPLFLVSLCCQLDRSNLAFAALQMNEELGFSRTVHGLGSGLFFLGYLAQVPAQAACIALSPRRFLPATMVAWAAVAMCFAAVRNRAGFLALRLLLGVTEAGTYPAIIYQLQLFYPPRRLGVVFTYVTTATAVAGLLGAPIAAALLSLDGLGGLSGWRWLFLLEGLPTLTLAAALPCLLPASPLAAGFLSAAEQRWLWAQRHGGADVELVASSTAQTAAAAAAEQSGPGQAAAPAGPFSSGDAEHGKAQGASYSEQRPLLPQQLDSPAGRGGAQEEPHWEQGGRAAGSGGLTKADFRQGLLDGRIWHLAACMLLIDAVMNAANFWVPTLVRAILQGRLAADAASSMPEHGASSGSQASAALNVQAALLSALPFCAAALAMVLNAHHARRTDERRLHTALPMLCTAVALGLLPLLARAGAVPALLGLTTAAAGTWAVHGPFFSWPAALLEPEAAALGFALVKTGGALGGFSGPLLVGALADGLHGFAGAMLLLAGVAGACAVLVLLFRDGRG